jgi:hypothetical protein
MCQRSKGKAPLSNAAAWAFQEQALLQCGLYAIAVGREGLNSTETSPSRLISTPGVLLQC